MGSPGQIPYRSFIHIDRASTTPVYMQVTHQLINAIQRGYLLTGTKLPGTRLLSSTLAVHRKTIIAVYEELDAQGWIEIRPNKGSFVLQKKDAKGKRISTEKQNLLAYYPEKTGYSFEKSSLLDNPFEFSSCHYSFNDGTPDIRLTQIEQLSKFYSSNIKRKSNLKKLGYHNSDGSEYFKENLSNYLNLSRGLHISKENILITRSTEMSVYIISEILLRALDIVVVASLSYFSVNMIFQKSGARIVQVPVDEEGIQVDALEKLCRQYTIRMLYLTPHHHYPTTVSLTAERRVALLDLAHQYGFIILEDDYDYDFHYDQKALLPLASADTNGMVIYIGAFGKSLAPGFRTGFIVAPQNVMAEMRKYLGIIDRQGDVLMEMVLAEMIAEGEINRHLKKSIKIYQERRNLFVNILNQTFGENIHFQQPSGGLAVWVQWKNPINLLQVSQECRKEQLFIPKNLLYQHKDLTAMRLGFGHMNKEEMNSSLAILKRNIDVLTK
ncbi:PLP-dependent aminotransferase family protein [Sphingobacterium sp. UT-1RO-CII-1]|uniref:MocR-like pyridoxine biosynthesis transcription factor PdxR n=1 Tax=Sphingobacterium sp. UT-1RO-CII-1 TaxID=2995225 RepID=UPI00227A2ADB|nr:PLP-dependent aminotransferase family protein [Sphingobacterium sp. UT-1RO-CII-1]MCY4780422.1 PLP-dependent aminotransferase family protein [Sphingobacterium sp. UT-1RO-CII-1]